MKLMNSSDFKAWLSYLLLIICGIIAYACINNLPAFALAIGVLVKYLSPFFAGFIIAYLLDIPCSGIERLIASTGQSFLKKHARGLAVIVTYTCAILAIAITTRLIVPEVVRSVMEFAANIQTYFQRTADFISELTQDESLIKALGYEAFISELSVKSIIDAIGYNSLWQSVVGLLSVSAYLLNVTIAVISSVYLLLEARTIGRFFANLTDAFIPRKNTALLFKYLDKTNQYFKKFLYCTIVDGVIIGAASVVGLLVIDTRYAVALGVIEGVFNMVPYFGAIVGSVIVAVIVLFTDGVAKAAAVGLFLFILQQIDGNVIKIKLYGDSFQISPFLVLLSITIGGRLYGVLGMVIAIPVVAIIKTMLDDAIAYKQKKNSEGI